MFLLQKAARVSLCKLRFHGGKRCTTQAMTAKSYCLIAVLLQQAALSFRVAAADAPAKQRLDAFLAGKMPQASRARLQVSCCQCEDFSHAEMR